MRICIKANRFNIYTIIGFKYYAISQIYLSFIFLIFTIYKKNQNEIYMLLNYL